MALRRQHISPTANLLRNSRLFSLPNPLPRPSVSESKSSDSATLPYPTHQAIVTTQTSLARGDWGLKRAIPSRSRIVQTSNPVLLVKQLDSIEHVTDYDSAADHVRTREKFQELGIPMLRGMASLRDHGHAVLPPTGAFEHRSDLTSYEGDEGLDDAAFILETIKQSIVENKKASAAARRAKRKDKDAPESSFVPYSLPLPDQARHNVRRWKHEGPWLPGMNDDEFTTYVAKQLDTRKQEFRRILVQYVKNEIYTTRQNASRNSQALPLDAAEAETALVEEEKKWSNITPRDLDAGIKALRQEAAVDPLRSKLFTRLIIPFLRIPTPKLKNTRFSESATKNDFQQYRFDDDATPLSTHPSAGLGYSRTNAYLYNHPILGPQAERSPVTARVVQPVNLPGRSENRARLGVAGFVVSDSELGNYQNNRNAKTNTLFFDHKTPGGAKVDVLPQFASVSADGRINMQIKRSHDAEVMVKRGELDDRPPVRFNADSNPLKELLSLSRNGNGSGNGNGNGNQRGYAPAGNNAQAKKVESMIRAHAQEHVDDEAFSRRAFNEAVREEPEAQR